MVSYLKGVISPSSTAPMERLPTLRLSSASDDERELSVKLFGPLVVVVIITPAAIHNGEIRH